jgi:galactoside 2-L-fucosyltransferase 1/2
MSFSNDAATSKSKIYFQKSGRLGNMLCEYASLYMLARFYDRELIIDEEMARVLNKTFAMKSRTTQYQRYFIGNAPITRQIYDFREKEQYFNISTKDDFIVRNYFITYLYRHTFYEHAMAEVYDLFTFHSTILADAKSAILSAVLHTNPCPIIIRTLVGIHVRMGDRVSGNLQNIPANRKYYIHAMQYFINKYPAVHFIIASEERGWCEVNLLGLPNVSMLPAGGSGEVDMAALSLCDHVIMSIGTYGLWAGLLARGETVFYSQRPCRLNDETGRICMEGGG